MSQYNTEIIYLPTDLPPEREPAKICDDPCDDGTGINWQLVSKRKFFRSIIEGVNLAFRDPKNQAAFEAWYLENYGEPYKSPENAL